jgi:hypothetical protein
MDFRRVCAFHGISFPDVCDISITEYFDFALLFKISEDYSESLNRKK